MCVCGWDLGVTRLDMNLLGHIEIKESDGNQTFDKSGPEAKGTKTSKEADPMLPMQQDLAWMG